MQFFSGTERYVRLFERSLIHRQSRKIKRTQNLLSATNNFQTPSLRAKRGNLVFFRYYHKDHAKTRLPRFACNDRGPQQVEDFLGWNDIKTQSDISRQLPVVLCEIIAELKVRLQEGMENIHRGENHVVYKQKLTLDQTLTDRSSPIFHSYSYQLQQLKILLPAHTNCTHIAFDNDTFLRVLFPLFEIFNELP